MLATTFIARAADGLILCETYDSSSSQQGERLKVTARKLIGSAKFQQGEQCSTDIEDHKLHFITREGIVYLTIADRAYNMKLVFVFLQEIALAFQDELRNTYGTASNIDY